MKFIYALIFMISAVSSSLAFARATGDGSCRTPREACIERCASKACLLKNDCTSPQDRHCIEQRCGSESDRCFKSPTSDEAGNESEPAKLNRVPQSKSK